MANHAPVMAIFGFAFGLVFLMQLISWSNPTGAVTAATFCADSDGETASVPGTVTIIGNGERTYADTCKSPTVATEKVCTHGTVESIDIPCNDCVMDNSGIGYCKR
ncbi:MAG: hypothetical protein HY363_01115 [Candidatus Aenigmarchaeota archaeon]|nr:hypothetical protein [Candidatus Aenigmarchaeota archaeon]